MRLLLAVLLLLPSASFAQDADSLDELEPLVIRAVRDRLPASAPIDPQINATLLRLLQQRQDARPTPTEQADASVGNLVKLTTATGYKLKTRYTELGFLLTEGLAGVKDFQLSSEMERVVRLGKNVQTRAAAMVALAYTKDMRYQSLFQSALQDPNVTVRFGALESLLLMDNSANKFIVMDIAQRDLSPVMKIYAAAGLWKMGDPNGREILLRMYQDQDWFTRAMAVRYMGEYGGSDEYRKLFILLTQETHPAVRAELCSALLRLQKFKT
jgi:hypothetical protein